MMMSNIEDLSESLKAKGGGNEKEIIVSLFWLMSRLFGFYFVSGKVFNEPFYHQSYGRYVREKVNQDSDKRIYDVDKEEKRNTITIQKKVYRFLKDSGLSDNKIAQVMNATEYDIKTMKHNL